MNAITVNALTFSYPDNAPALRNVSLSINQGETWAVIGKNGSGKSTLLKCVGGLLGSRHGMILVEGRPVRDFRPKELARRIAYVPQAGGRPLPQFTVAEFVMLGRFPYQGFFAIPNAIDRKIVLDAMRLADVDAFAARSMQTLSGGELQRVFLAAAVAQRPALLLLDEPMSFLDPLHQEMVFRALARIHDEFNTTLIAATHDVNYAMNRFSHLCALKESTVFFSGPVELFKKNALDYLGSLYSLSFSEISSYNGDVKYYLPKGLV